jgi:hypothetical protein
MNLTRQLYRTARIVNTVSKVAEGKGGRRAVNLVKGRVLSKAGFWRALWR